MSVHTRLVPIRGIVLAVGRAYKIDPELPDCRRILEMLKDRIEFSRGLHNSCQKNHDDSGS